MCYEECNGHQSNVQSSKALGSVKWEINTAATLIQNRLFIASLLATYACAVLIWLHQYACKAITYRKFYIRSRGFYFFQHPSTAATIRGRSLIKGGFYYSFFQITSQIFGKNGHFYVKSAQIRVKTLLLIQVRLLLKGGFYFKFRRTSCGLYLRAASIIGRPLI